MNKELLKPVYQFDFLIVKKKNIDLNFNSSKLLT